MQKGTVSNKKHLFSSGGGCKAFLCHLHTCTIMVYTHHLSWKHS